MTERMTEQFVFLVITWGENGQEAFGPFAVQPGYPHLDEIAKKAKAWRAEHPDRPGMAVHLFATRLLPPDEKPKPKVQLNITSPAPSAGVIPVPVIPEGWLRNR